MHISFKSLNSNIPQCNKLDRAFNAFYTVHDDDDDDDDVDDELMMMMVVMVTVMVMVYGIEKYFKIFTLQPIFVDMEFWIF